MVNPSLIENDLDFSVLKEDGAYADYFSLLYGVLTKFKKCLPSEESQKTGLFLNKFLHTIGILKFKYTYPSEGQRQLWIDVTESGFPNFAEMTELVVELKESQNTLRDLPPSSLLKRALVDYLMKYHKEAPDILSQLSRRTYVERLAQNSSFLPFTSGELVRIDKTDSEHRRYEYSWACYDFTTNRPYLHNMIFEQDWESEALENMGEAWETFLQVLEGEGGRAPEMAVLATAIDDALEDIHPKLLRRLCIGPLYTPLFPRIDPTEKRASVFRQALLANNMSKEFVLFFTNEAVFSKRQEVSTTFFNPGGKTREIYAVDQVDSDCMERKASSVQLGVLLPHRLLQSSGSLLSGVFEEFRKAKKFIYDETGDVHGL